MPRADTIREKIMDELISRLQTINIANGDMFTPTLIERKGQELPESPTYPAIYIYEGEEQKEAGMMQMLCELPILIVFLAEGHSDQLKVGGKMLENLVRAIGTDFSVLDANGNAVGANFSEVSNDIIAGDTALPVIYVELVIIVNYSHSIGNLTTVGC